MKYPKYIFLPTPPYTPYQLTIDGSCYIGQQSAVNSVESIWQH